MKQLKNIGLGLALAASAIGSAHANVEVSISGGPNASKPNVAIYGTTYFQDGGLPASIAMNSFTGMTYTLAGYKYGQQQYVRALEYFATTDTGMSFAAYCIGLTTDLIPNGSTYSLTDTQSDSLGRLFKYTGFSGNAWKTDGVTSVESVALQVAIWEVMQDGLVGGPGEMLFNLDGGNLKFTSINSTVKSLANDFLLGAASLKAGTYSPDVRIFTSLDTPTSQPLVTTVPEPSTYAMLAACLGVIGLVTRRKSA